MQFGSEHKAAYANTVVSKNDPFNYPMLNRADLMSLNTITAKQDGMKTTTFKFQTGRGVSHNLATSDIIGKLHFSYLKHFYKYRRCP